MAPRPRPFASAHAGNVEPGRLPKNSPCGFIQTTGRTGDGRVLKLAKGSTVATVPPFKGLDRTWSVAVDADGNVYVADLVERVLMLPAK
jgi:hypothetical protein